MNKSDTLVIYYGRYSTDEQSPKSIEDQFTECDKERIRQGYPPPAKTFSDEAYSVRDNTAPNWTELINYVRKNTGRKVIVFVDEFSRVARTQIDKLEARRMFRFLKASLYFVMQKFDILEDNAKFRVMLSGFSDEEEIEKTAHRVKRGMEGNLYKNLSNGDIGYGYRSVPIKDPLKYGLVPRKKDERPYKRVVIYEEEAEVIRKIHRMFNSENYAIGEIVRWLNDNVPPGEQFRRKEWKRSNVCDILERRKYLGLRTWNKTTHEYDPIKKKRVMQYQASTNYIECHFQELQILPQEEWDKTQIRLAENARLRKKRLAKAKARGISIISPKHLFSGNLYCAGCGNLVQNISGSRMKGGYYGCRRVYRNKCKNQGSVSRLLAEELILTEIKRVVLNEKWVDPVYKYVLEVHEQYKKSLSKDLKPLNKKLQKLEREYENLVSAFAKHGFDELISEKIKDRNLEIAKLKMYIREQKCAKEKPVSPPTKKWVKQQLFENFEMLINEDPKRAAFLLRKITGPIMLHTATLPWRDTCYLIAKFTINIPAVLASGFPEEFSDYGKLKEYNLLYETKIHLRIKTVGEMYADEVLKLKGEGKSDSQISKLLGIGTTSVQLAYNFAKWGNIYSPNDRRYKGSA